MAAPISTPVARPGAGAAALTGTAGLALAALVGVGCAAALQSHPVSVGLLAVGGAGLLGVLALAIVRYEAAVALGLVLLAVVRVEPAPPDVVFAVVIAVALVTGRFDVLRAPLVITAAISCFLLLNILSAVDAVDPNRAALFFGITLYLCVFALWFASYLRDERRARQVVLAYVGAAVGSALLGTLALTLRFPGSALFIGASDTRARALFEDPNVFGPFLVPAALLLLEESVRGRLLGGGRMLKAVLFLVIVVGVLMSYSRGAWLNLVVGTIVMLLVLAFRRRSGGGALGLLVLVVMSAVAVAGFVAFTDSASFLEQRAQVQAYDADRFEAQRRGVQLGERNVFGIGPGQFELVSPVVSHSIYVRVLAEQGVLGFAIVVALLLTTLVYALRNATLGRDTHGIGSAALLGAWCGLLANSLVVDTLHWRHLWVVAALVWVGALRR